MQMSGFKLQDNKHSSGFAACIDSKVLDCKMSLVATHGVPRKTSKDKPAQLPFGLSLDPEAHPIFVQSMAAWIVHTT